MNGLLDPAAVVAAGNAASEAYRARSAFLARLWELTPDEQERENLAFAVCATTKAREAEVFGDPRIKSTIDSRRVSW